MTRSSLAQPLTPEAIELVAATFRVLSEPIRLRILQALHHGECSVNEIALRIGTPQPNASKHLKVLCEAGLVARRQQKTQVFYRISNPLAFQLCDLVCKRHGTQSFSQSRRRRSTSRPTRWSPARIDRDGATSTRV